MGYVKFDFVLKAVQECFAAFLRQKRSLPSHLKSTKKPAPPTEGPSLFWIQKDTMRMCFRTQG